VVCARHGVVALPGLPQGYSQEDPPGLRKVTRAYARLEYGEEAVLEPSTAPIWRWRGGRRRW
jgi:hypothetical protein